MKNKLLIFICACIFVIPCFGCKKKNTDPVKVVEDYIKLYKKLDSSVMDSMPYVISPDMTETENDTYKGLIEKQYLNFSYSVYNSSISENTATVSITFTVFDYIGTIDKADNYVNLYSDKFMNDKKEVDKYKVIDYKLDQMEKCIDKQEVTVMFDLTKYNDSWELNKLTDTEIMKIQGLF